ncbi:hypothetical protein B0T14DRAFT_569666 [Immersiella caudata]|uniref:Uncharacterized protein n=1 Tax=Immersiella caudata TaxID=314043 RepID=A0AA40BU21_9PEZI|nr:hypothetical protein B0T14DRAFT_569666 [Immersiella caudata]
MISQVRNGTDGETPTAVEPGAPTTATTSPSSPEPNEMQTLAFGIIGTFLAIIGLYVAYRQLLAIRHRREPSTQLNGHEDDDSEPPRADHTPHPNATDPEQPIVTAGSSTL